MNAKNAKPSVSNTKASHKPWERVSPGETVQLGQRVAELSGNTAFRLNDLAGGANFHVPVFSSNVIFDRTAGGVFESSRVATGGDVGGLTMHRNDAPANPDGRRLVKKLLAERPNEKQRRAAKQAFSDCDEKRSVFAVGRLLLSFAGIALLGLFVNFFSSLVFFYFMAVAGALSPIFIWVYTLLEESAKRRYPLPRIYTDGHPDKEPALNSFNLARLTESDRRRLETSPCARDYLDGISKQEVPLLVMDLDVLERLFAIDTQYKQLSEKEQKSAQPLAQIHKSR